MIEGEQVYLNGSFMAASDATVSVGDRGFVFADGIYEVTPAYRGRFLQLDRHLARLQQGIDALRLQTTLTGLAEVHDELLHRNGLADAPWSMVYLQLTRGVARRSHGFPNPTPTPTCYAFARRLEPVAPDRWQRGYSAITTEDTRWQRVDLKTIMLLPNVLAQQAAIDAGVDDALLVRAGRVLEGSHANLFALRQGVLHTAPADRHILAGITRQAVLDLAAAADLEVEHLALEREALYDADEVFLCGATTELKPLVRIDGRAIGNGSVGPLTRSLYQAFRRLTQEHGP